MKENILPNISIEELEQQINNHYQAILSTLINGQQISVLNQRDNQGTVKPEKLFPGLLPPVPHPSKSSIMEGLFTESGELRAIRKTYGKAPEVGELRTDGQRLVPQGHSYPMDSGMAKETMMDVLTYQKQLEAIGIKVPELLDLKIKKNGSDQFLVSYDQIFIKGYNFEDVFKLACEAENPEALGLLVEGMLQYLKQIINYKVSVQDEIFQTIPQEDELPLALDLKPNNFVIHFDESGKPSLWFIDIFAPGNRDKEPSTPFIRRFLDQADGDIAWKHCHERLIKKSGIYSKLALELESIVFTLETPNSLRSFYLETIMDQIEKFIVQNEQSYFILSLQELQIIFKRCAAV